MTHSLKNKRLLAALLTTTILLTSGCDEGAPSQTSQADGQNDGTSYVNYYAPGGGGFVIPATPTVSGNFLAGQFAQQHADWVAAARHYEGILRLSPDNLEIKQRIMVLSLGSGNFERAKALAQELLALKEKASGQSLAKLIATISDFKNKDYAKVIAAQPPETTDTIALAILPLLKAWAAADQGKTDIADLKANPALAYHAVMIAAYTKDKQAIADLAANIDFTKTPTPIERVEDVADIFAAYGAKKAAQSLYAALAESVPARRDIYMGKSKDIDGTAAISPLYIPPANVQNGLSQSLTSVAQLLTAQFGDSARILLELGLYLEPDNADALELLASEASGHELYGEAIAYLQRIDWHGNTEEQTITQRQIALLLEQSGQTDEAVRVLGTLPNNVEAQIQIGDIYRKQEKFKEALYAYNKAFELAGDPVPQKYWDLIFARGMTYERLKKWDDAERDLKLALTYEPDHPYVLNYLGYSWADQGLHLDKAAEMIEKAVRIRPDDGAIVDSLGWVYYRMGNYPKAAETLEKAIELLPNEAEINDHLGDAYWQTGRKNEARFQWKRAVSFSKSTEFTQKTEEKISGGLTSPLSSAAQPKSDHLVSN